MDCLFLLGIHGPHIPFYYLCAFNTRNMSIEVKALTKLYGEQRAIDQISFEIPKGQIVGFLGPNGAGKSTTMKILTGYLPQSSGQAKVCGFDVETQSLEVRKRIGYLPESNPLYFDMYVREYLEFSAGMHHMEKDKRKARIDEMLQLTGLYREEKKKIGALSKGYKQRVGLAQAMLHNPEVLILDEPTSGLDPNQLVEIRDLITSIGKEKTVMLSTHIMQEVQAMCNRVIIINRGKIVADDEIQNLQARKTGSNVIVAFDKAIDKAILQKLNNVQRIENSGQFSFSLATAEPDKVRKQLLELSVQHNLNIQSLTSNNQNLEDIFRELTGESKA